MNQKARARNETRVRALKALAHPTRLFLALALAGGERCVNDLTALAGCDVSTVSKHLSQLREAGVLEKRREGLTVYYSRRGDTVDRLAACLDEFTRRGERKTEASRAKSAKKSPARKPARRR